MINTIIKHIRARWVFMVLFVTTLTLMIVAERLDSLVLAGIGAMIAFVAGSEYGDHHICHNCAMDMVVADPEIPEHYPVA
jgi:hypothetical protein